MSGSVKRWAFVALVGVVAIGLAACGDDNSSSSATTASSSKGSSVTVTSKSFTATSPRWPSSSRWPRPARARSPCCCPTRRRRPATSRSTGPTSQQAFEAAGLQLERLSRSTTRRAAPRRCRPRPRPPSPTARACCSIDALDSGSGAAIEANATSKGVKVIDYDRLVKGGPDGRIYVSFDNVKVGKLIGQGFVDCIDGWKVAKPNVLVMDGDPDRQQRQAVRPGLQRRAEAEVRRRQLREGRRAGRHLDAVGRGHHVHPAATPRTRTSTPSSRRTTTTPTP